MENLEGSSTKKNGTNGSGSRRPKAPTPPKDQFPKRRSKSKISPELFVNSTICDRMSSIII
jgi:hypothetical protein